MRRQQYEKIKSKEILPSLQTETTNSNLKTDIVNAQSIARSIDKTIKEFNDKYGSTLLDNNNKRMVLQPKDHPGNNYAKVNDKTKETALANLENNLRRLNILDDPALRNDDELLSLAPLELPSFDYSVFGTTTDLAENFQ